MANIINAITTGTGGVSTTADSSGAIQIATNNGTTALTLDTSQNATFAGKVTSAGALTLASNGSTTAVTIDTSQNVGIGRTPSGSYILEVNNTSLLSSNQGSSTGTVGTSLALDSKTSGAYATGQGSALAFQITNSAGAQAGCKISSINNADNNTADLVFYPRNYGYTEAVRINSTGAIGLNGTNYGTSGQFLTSNGSGATASWTTVSAGGMTLLGTITVTAANSVSLGSLSLTNYKAIFIAFSNVYNGAGAFYVSSNNVQSGGGSTIPPVSGDYGTMWVDLATGALGGVIGANPGNQYSASGPTSITTSSTTIYFRNTGSSNWTASGSILIYGVK
jgi:hypothetical protein